MGWTAWFWQRGAGRLAVLAAAALCGFAGCETASQERVREYNADGVHLFQQGNYPDARESFALALELQPEDPALFYNLGQCCDRLGDALKAEQYYWQCLQRSANHADCRHALAVLLYRTGRKMDANRMIEDWLAGQPTLAGPYALDGWRLRQEGALPDAQGRLHQALELDAKNGHALAEL